MVQQSRPSEEILGATEARVRAGRAVREIGHALVGRHASDALLDEVAETLTTLTARLDQAERRFREHDSFQRRDTEPITEDGAAFVTYADRPYSGISSPLGADLNIVRRGDEVVANFTLRSAHEGAPTRSHGGVVAAIFDDVYGFVLQLHRLPAFTGELYLRYEAGTPIGRPLELRTRLDRRDGRKLFMSGDLWDGETRLVRSTATFIERVIA